MRGFSRLRTALAPVGQQDAQVGLVAVAGTVQVADRYGHRAVPDRIVHRGFNQNCAAPTTAADVLGLGSCLNPKRADGLS